VACGILDQDKVPETWRSGGRASGQVGDGGSAIIGPSGYYLAGPVYEAETIVYADIDLTELAQARRGLDVGGHYARPDVVRLLFDATAHDVMVEAKNFDPPEILP
jgi:nitrilase